jgi:hypothetical protein
VSVRTDALRQAVADEARDISVRRCGMWLRGVGVCAAAYLYGALPLVYLLGRTRRVDLTRSGSGNVGATNLLAAGGPAVATAGWTFDASKGLVPVLAGKALGCSQTTAELAGVCGVVGQCWPVFLRFRGGRGISAYVGAASQMDREVWALALVPMIAGGLWRLGRVGRARARGRHGSGTSGGQVRATRSKSVPVGCFVSVALFGGLASFRRRTEGRSAVAPALLSAVLLLRRLTAPLPDDATNGPGIRRVALWNRLLYDRNTSS